jgi:hypothetical protein
MSREGVKAAVEHGRRLPAFPDLHSAELALYQRRDELIRKLNEAAGGSTVFDPDLSPESLKSLEEWYFSLWDSESFDATGMDREEFECSMAMYFGELLVRNVPEFEWTVAEYAWQAGKYEIGVRKPLVSVMFRGFSDLHARPNNKRQQSIWREYQQYAS